MLVFLGLKAQVLHHPVKEVLGKLSVLLLGRGATLGDRFVGLHEGVGELRGGLVYPLLALLVMNSLSSSLRCFPLQLRCTVVVRAQLCMSLCMLPRATGVTLLAAPVSPRLVADPLSRSSPSVFSRSSRASLRPAAGLRVRWWP